MMQNYAVVNAGLIVNVIVWDGITEYVLPEWMTVVAIPPDSLAAIGWSWDGSSFSSPAGI